LGNVEAKQLANDNTITQKKITNLNKVA